MSFGAHHENTNNNCSIARFPCDSTAFLYFIQTDVAYYVRLYYDIDRTVGYIRSKVWLVSNQRQTPSKKVF